jgi:biopolymer transport protein ExbD
MNLTQRNKVESGGNMSSMTDLVFLLLIFFIILSTLVSNGVNVDLPQSKGTSSASSRLTVSIKPDGSYYLNGTAITRADIEPALRVKFADQADPVLYLQVDQAVPTGQTVEVIGLAKANDWKVMLGAQPPR